MAHNFHEQDCINLLQGEYSRKEQFEKLIRPWRSAAAIVFVWLLLQVGLLVTEYQTLVGKDAALRSEILAVYKDAFPDSKNIVDPKLQMKRGLEKLQGGGTGNNDMISLLATTGEIISDTSGMTVRSIRYKSETLDVDIEIADLQALDALKTRLVKEAGLNVEIVSASSRSGKVESRLQIRPA
jgi:general secretion pathway protein L